MGFGIYLFWPAFYTDVTDSYRLGRAGRVRTDLGGLYFNALVVLASFAVWWLTGWHAVLLLVATQMLQMIRQLLPLLRFDGYHVLADLTGVPDLYQRIGPVLSRPAARAGWHQPEATALKTWARVVVIAWVLVVVPLMAFTLLLMVLALPRLLAHGVGVAPRAGRPARRRLRRRRHPRRPRPAARRSSPSSSRCSGIGYVLVRLVTADRVAASWRRTDGPAGPARRSPLLLAAALVAGLGWAWWPAGRPVPAGARLGGRHGAGRGARRQQHRARRGLPRHRGHRLARRRRPAAHRGRPGAGPGPGARRRRGSAEGSEGTTRPATPTAAEGAAPDLGLPVRPAAAARRGRQPGAGGEHRGRVGPLRRHASRWSGPTATRRSTSTRPTRWPAAGTAARSRWPSRSCCWSARSTSSCRRTSPPRSTTPASSA